MAEPNVTPLHSINREIERIQDALMTLGALIAKVPDERLRAELGRAEDTVTACAMRIDWQAMQLAKGV